MLDGERCCRLPVHRFAIRFLDGIRAIDIGQTHLPMPAPLCFGYL